MGDYDFFVQTSNSSSIPTPDSSLEVPINIDPVALVNGILDCYKDITIAKEEQLTLRTKIREQSRVYIAAIEANTKEFELALEQIKVERMEFVKLVCDIIRQDGVDEFSLKLCEHILNYLNDSNPMNHAGEFFRLSNTVSGLIDQEVN